MLYEVITQVLLQIDDAVAIGPEDVFNLLKRQLSQAVFVPRRFDDHFMRADPIHPIIETDPFAAQIAFYMKGGKLIRDYTDSPVRRIGLRGFNPIGHDFFRRQPFLTRAEGAEGCP